MNTKASKIALAVALLGMVSGTLAQEALTATGAPITVAAMLDVPAAPVTPGASAVTNNFLNAGIVADLGSTAVGLARGATEANPLGLAIIPLKFIVKAQINRIGDENQRREKSAQFAGMQFGAAAANVCTLAIANPVAALACFVGGMAFGYQQVKAIPTSQDCSDRHMAHFQEAADTGRVYKVDLKTCLGHFEARSAQYAASRSPGPGAN